MNVLVWQDAQRAHVTGKLTVHKQGDLANSSMYKPGSQHRVDTEGSHRLTVGGHVDTSHGRVETTVGISLANISVDRWTDGETTEDSTPRGRTTSRSPLTAPDRPARRGRTGRTRWTARPRWARTTGCAPCRPRRRPSEPEPGCAPPGRGSTTPTRATPRTSSNVPRDQRHAVPHDKRALPAVQLGRLIRPRADHRAGSPHTGPQGLLSRMVCDGSLGT